MYDGDEGVAGYLLLFRKELDIGFVNPSLLVVFVAVDNRILGATGWELSCALFVKLLVVLATGFSITLSPDKPWNLSIRSGVVCIFGLSMIFRNSSSVRSA